MKHRTSVLGLVLAVALCTSISQAQGLSGGPYTINPLDVNGGGSRSAGGLYAVTASTAQAGGVGVIAAGMYRSSDGFWPAARHPAHVVGSKPADGESLWRHRKNVVRLIFDDDIVVPQAGEVLIQEMLTGGAYGPDLSSGFTLTVDNDEAGNPRILKIAEKASALSHRKWYAISNAGWPEAADFIVQYVVQVGDADRDGQVLNKDIGLINAAIPNLKASDDDPRDINGDGRILNRDVGLANGQIPSPKVPKPDGH